jgi:photosystem II stability/assembly factor-like uncharacterized protein
MESTYIVATAGQGVIRSADQGKTWHRTGLKQPFAFDAIVRSLDSDPVNAAMIYAGTDIGLCRSYDAGSNWELVDSPFSGQTVWKVAVDPKNPDRILVGTGAPSRANLWRSLDAGRNWTRANVDIPEFCGGVHRPRLLAIAYDSNDPKRLWFGLEEGGLFLSRDGGDNWQRIDDRLLWDFRSDIHAITVLPDSDNTVVVVAVNAIYTTRNGGDSWEGSLAQDTFGLYYARALGVAPHATTLYLSVSDGTPGTTGRVYTSADGAKTWNRCSFSDEPTSCIWALRANSHDASQLIGGTKYGELFLTHDGGRLWRKEWRSFSEITDVLWLPVRANITASHKSLVNTQA